MRVYFTHHPEKESPWSGHIDAGDYYLHFTAGKSRKHALWCALREYTAMRWRYWRYDRCDDCKSFSWHVVDFLYPPREPGGSFREPSLWAVAVLIVVGTLVVWVVS